jgi:hypothetical protein
MRKVMRFCAWEGEPLVTLGEPIGDAEVFTFAGGRWVEVSPVRIIPNASEITEVRFGLRYPTAYRARRWLPKTEAARNPEDVRDPKDVRLDNMMIAAHEALEAERRAQEGASPPHGPSASPDTDHEPPDEAA